MSSSLSPAVWKQLESSGGREVQLSSSLILSEIDLNQAASTAQKWAPCLTSLPWEYSQCYAVPAEEMKTFPSSVVSLDCSPCPSPQCC